MRKSTTASVTAAVLSLSACIPQSSPPPSYYDRAPDARVMSANDQVWKGDDGAYHCRRKDGTTGLVVGAVAGGILGNIIFGGDVKTLGTIAGAVGGGLLGRSVERGEVKCR